MKSFWELLKATFKEWQEDKISVLAAALSFYAVLSLAPLLILLVTVVGWFYDAATVRAELMGQLQQYIGPQGAQVAVAILEGADQPQAASIAGIFSLLVLLWGASNVFVQLQNSLNTIWNVELKPEIGWKGAIKERLTSFGLIMFIGVLILAFLILSAVLSTLSGAMGDLFPGVGWIWQIVNLVVSFAVITVLFGIIYKMLPDVKIGWHSVWLGAAFTALLFTIGNALLGLYLGFQGTSSVYGAFGSIIVLLIWVFYSAQIFFFGAEFTQVYARRRGRRIVPDSKARYINEPPAAVRGSRA
jgi:membrane protein